jgi:hypothetical protein
MKTTLLALLAMLCITFVASAADVTGKWTGEITTGRGPQPFNIELKQAGSALTGVITGGRGGDITIAEGKVEGDTITFTTSTPGRDGGPPNVQKYTGKVSGDSIEFTREGGRGPVTFTAKKQ